MGKWTIEKLMADALKYQTRGEWEKKSSGAYKVAMKRGIMDECCGHMTVLRKSWTYEELKADALKYQTRKDWREKSGNAYHAAARRGILKECCAHMTVIRHRWTNDEVKADALNYQTRNEWRQKSPKAYDVAKRRRLVGDCCGHMPKRDVTRWTVEMLKIEALKYKTKKEWRKKSKSYWAAKDRGIVEECCAHMTTLHENWTAEKIMDDAKHYKTRAQWAFHSPNAYAAARRNNALEECCSHMEYAEGGSRDDAIYIWEAVGEQFNGKPVYKIGVTSAHLDDQRINIVANRSGFCAKIIILCEVTTSARSIESQLLELGEHPGYEGFDGCTEFRAMTEDELTTALNIINSHQPNGDKTCNS